MLAAVLSILSGVVTDRLGSRLVLLGSDRSVTALAQLPGLQSAGLPASGEARALA